MVHRRVLQCGLCRNKEKYLKPGLKCVNRWSSSTVQRKRVPESWSSNRETTSSSVQVVRRNWQKLLCGRPQRTRLTVWADQMSVLVSRKFKMHGSQRVICSVSYSPRSHCSLQYCFCGGLHPAHQFYSSIIAIIIIIIIIIRWVCATLDCSFILSVC